MKDEILPVIALCLFAILVVLLLIFGLPTEEQPIKKPIEQIEIQKSDDNDGCNKFNALNPCSPLYESPANPMIQSSVF